MIPDAPLEPAANHLSFHFAMRVANDEAAMERYTARFARTKMREEQLAARRITTRMKEPPS